MIHQNFMQHINLPSSKTQIDLEPVILTVQINLTQSTPVSPNTREKTNTFAEIGKLKSKRVEMNRINSNLQIGYKNSLSLTVSLRPHPFVVIVCEVKIDSVIFLEASSFLWERV